MSREFEVVVTEGMNMAGDLADEAMGEALCFKTIFYAMAAHPDFRAQLRAWAAEEMRGLVPREAVARRAGKEWMDTITHNSCRAETLANIERWRNEND